MECMEMYIWTCMEIICLNVGFPLVTRKLLKIVWLIFTLIVIIVGKTYYCCIALCIQYYLYMVN